MDTTLKKLNLGCGEDKKEGYVNVDFHSHVKPDVVHDLNVVPYPFAESTFDLVEAYHVLEHLDKPFVVMKELHRILKPGGTIHIKVPHFSRGFTHPEHKSGFDLMFPFYFNKNFTKSGYFGVDFKHVKSELHWAAHKHLYAAVGVPKPIILIVFGLNTFLNALARLSPNLCSRLWCFWVGGFEEVEFVLTCEK